MRLKNPRHAEIVAMAAAGGAFDTIAATLGITNAAARGVVYRHRQTGREPIIPKRHKTRPFTEKVFRSLPMGRAGLRPVFAALPEKVQRAVLARHRRSPDMHDLVVAALTAYGEALIAWGIENAAG